MKKLIPLFLLMAVTFASCQKDPDSGKLDDNFVALTEKAPNVNFSNFSTFYLADTINVEATNSQSENYWLTKSISDDILNEVQQTLVNRGFTLSENIEDAQLGVQITFMEDSHYYIGSNGYWNSGYWGYWGSYWGYPYYGGYYPGGYWGGFPLMYSLRVGILVMEIIDLQNPQDNKLPVLWNAWMGGLIYNQKFNKAACIDAIQQSFNQSPYLKK